MSSEELLRDTQAAREQVRTLSELRDSFRSEQEEKVQNLKGQSLVEFALILPILLFMMLGFSELAFLFASRAGFQNGADVLVQWAAEEMYAKPGESWKADWNRVVDEESERVGCISQRGPELSFPDVTHVPGDRVLLDWECVYQPKLTRDFIDLPVFVQSEAVVPGFMLPTPSALPSLLP